MRITKNILATLSLFGYCVAAMATSGALDSTQITDNLMKVCDKPSQAGKYWDVKVNGSGNADVKLKLAKIGITGGVQFDKGEWDGVRRTVEDAKDYRDCVKKLAPLFIQKFSKVSYAPNQNKPEKHERVLGGVSWEVSDGGVDFTLKSCKEIEKSVTCNLNAKATTSDLKIYISGKSAIFDQNGNKYYLSHVSVANFQGDTPNTMSSVTAELVRDVNTDVVLTFKDVGDNTRLVSKALIDAFVSGERKSGNYKYTFRKIKILVN